MEMMGCVCLHFEEGPQASPGAPSRGEEDGLVMEAGGLSGPLWLWCPLTRPSTLWQLARAVSRGFPGLVVTLDPGAALLLETLAAKLAAVFSGEDTMAKPSSFSYYCWGRAFLYRTPKAGAPLAKDVETTRCSAVAFGVDFTREIVEVWAGAFLERRSQLDVPNTCAMAVRARWPASP